MKEIIEKLSKTDDQDERTKLVHEWMKGLSDDRKSFFAINWRMPHTLFNISCKMLGGHESLQNIEWGKIYSSRDMGKWSHGGPVIVQSF